MRRLAGASFLPIAVAAIVAASSCQCDDEHDGWDFYEDAGTEVDAATFEDVALLPETDAGWQPEEVVPEVPIDHALNERTALTVDANGTVFLGFHRCREASCRDTELVVARRARESRRWTYETIKRQQGTFGIAVAIPEEVVAAFLDPLDNTFKVARRTGADEWELRTLGVRRTGPADGLDLAPDGERLFVTFANTRGDPVSLFALADGEWRQLESLDIGDASAAYERGLASDGQGNLFLVHRRGSDPAPWGIARYSAAEGRWRERTYYDVIPRPRPSSLVVSDTRRVCIAGDVSFGLMVTCGDITNIERDRWRVGDQVALGAGGYSSMLEGTDGALYVAYPAAGNTELRLAKKEPDADEWTVETVANKNAYGVSTVIDDDDLLLISYYTCRGITCSLEVLSRRQ